jgi:hypothetical protein
MKIMLLNKYKVSSSNAIIVEGDVDIDLEQICGITIIMNRYDKINQDVHLGWYRFTNCHVAKKHPLIISFQKKEEIGLDDIDIISDIIDLNF